MKTAGYETLAQSRTVRAALSAFGTLAGVPVTLLPASAPACHHSDKRSDATLCRLVNQTDGGRIACGRFMARLRARLERAPAPRAVVCVAGLTKLAVPVSVGGRLVATLMSGGFFTREPTEEAIERSWRRVQSAGSCETPAAFRQAATRSTILPPPKLRAACQLLGAVAAHLGEMAAHCLPVAQDGDPPCVTCAKTFVARHLELMPRTQSVASAAHVTEPYFCRMFKAAAGMTFSSYVARLHVERAKELLANQSLRVTEVAFAAGFQSIPHFNHTFRRFAGKSPTAYRVSLRVSRRAD